MNRNSLSRRRLLRGAVGVGAAAAFPAIVPASVLGQNAPSHRIHVAAIGTGGRGTYDCQHQFLPLADVRILAGVDVRRENREAFCRMVNQSYGAGVCKPYGDFREVLARPDIDAVVISTPDHWHVPLAYYAAKAKKDLYVEKPLGVAMAWAWKLREIVTRNRVVFQYGTQQRGTSRSSAGRANWCETGTSGKSGAWTPGATT